MRTMARGRLVASLAGALIAGGAALSLTSAASAAPIGGGGTGVAASAGAGGITLAQYGGSYCNRLRQACMYKRQLGETGAGNCARYRAQCSGGSYGYRPTYRYYRGYRSSDPYWRYRRGHWTD
jgi:hypothetical protein